MKFDLTGFFFLSNDVTPFKNHIKAFVSGVNKELLKNKGMEKHPSIMSWNLEHDKFFFRIVSENQHRAHTVLLQIKNAWNRTIGREQHIGVRSITIQEYKIEFELEKRALKPVVIPFAKEVKICGKQATMVLVNVSEAFLRHDYIDRMITLIKEKVANQYYEGKGEFWQSIWHSKTKKPVWSKDPTEEMIKLGWLKQGPTKGKWFYRPQSASLLRAMEAIAENEVLKPLGFQEVIESHIVPFDIWLKTGHLEGMPGEFYYIAEPASRDVELWQRFIDLTKITKKVPFDELEKNLSTPNTGICYAQCPVIYWSFKGKTISNSSLPLLIYDKTANSCRYESGGRHGIERVDEFHRIEPVFIGSKDQLLVFRDKLIKRYKHVFNDILDLEWRMAWVTPWYMQQAGKTGDLNSKETGTIDYEAYMPYRGERETSEWLEFQNLSILGDKYIKAFNIKAQKGELWSGCSGIGLERWAVVFLAQKGLDPKYWPVGFKNYLNKLPETIKFL